MEEKLLFSQNAKPEYEAPDATVFDLSIELAFLGEDDGSAGGFGDDEW